jgi:Carboxypeptidase regulatory-like domain
MGRWRSCLTVCILLLQCAAVRADECVKFYKRAPVPSVCGRIVNIAGETIDGIDVELIDEAGSGSSFWAHSDKKGRFVFNPVSQGDYTMRIDAPGYGKVVRQLRVTQTNDRHCRTQIEVTLGLKVCDTGTFVKGFDKQSDLLKELERAKGLSNTAGTDSAHQ